MRVKSIYFLKWLSVALVIGLGWYLYTKPMTQDRDVARFIKGKNTAIFAAYSPDGYVPHYVITYLRALKEVAPNIVFVTDNPLSLKAVHKISPYVTHVLAKRHGEYDWGSYKRGFQWLKEKGYAHKAASLILANDSVLMVTPSLKPIFEKMVGQADFWGITANQDYQYHLQSYFIVLEPKVYLNPQFETYLNSVTKQPDGLTVAVRYEVPFTKFLEDLGFSHEAYIPYKDLEYLELNDKNCYPLTMLSKHHAPFLKMRTFTTRLNIQEPKRLVLEWLKRNRPEVYYELTTHLKNINAL